METNTLRTALSDLCYELECQTDLLLAVQSALEHEDAVSSFSKAVYGLYIEIDTIRLKMEELLQSPF